MNDGSEMNNDQCFADVFNAFDELVTQKSEEHKKMKKRTSPSNVPQETAKGDGLNAEWLKPFDEGWQREIVLRNTNQNSGFRKADVYYYTPDNKKLRSCPEIECFLQNTESSLSIDCFTFKKERIHLEPSEIVRQAAQTRGRNRGGTNSTQSINDASMNAVASAAASSSSSVVAKEAPLEVHTPSVAVNVEKGTRGSASRKRPQVGGTSMSKATKQLKTKKVQMPDDWSAKLCSIYCFGQKCPFWPLDVFCGNCGYGFHFVCIGKSCFTADYVCVKCASETEPNNNGNTTDDSKDMAQVARSVIPNLNEQSKSQITSATLEKPQVLLLNKPFPRFYTSRISNSQSFSKKAYCIGSLPSPSPFCNFSNEQSVFMPNGIQIEPTEGKTKKELQNGKRKLTDTETCRTAGSEMSYYHLAYESLEHIFKYLSVVDLLNCRLVCKTWKNIASQPSLWNNKLCDFPERRQNLNSKRRNVKTDKLQEDDSVDSVDAFLKVPRFNRINLGSCQCTMVEVVIDGNRDMRLFSAELFMDNRKNIAENQWPDDVILDMKVFSGMDKLEILRLRAVGKLIPIDLDQISQMTSLRTLSLTSLHRMSGHDLVSIFTLPKLTVLELGDCYQWDQEVFKKLGEMQQIEILRLEARGEEEDSGFGAALLRMKNLRRLELARYTIGLELSNVLPKVTQLRQMCVWTVLLEDKLKTAHLFKHLMAGVQEMTFLWGLYLGIIAPSAEDSFNWNFGIPILSENGLDYELTDIHRVYTKLHSKLTNTKIMVQAVPLYNVRTAVKSQAAM